MGNEQHNTFKRAYKIEQPPRVSQPLKDMTNEVEQVFGICNKPVSHSHRPSHRPRSDHQSSRDQ